MKSDLAKATQDLVTYQQGEIQKLEPIDPQKMRGVLAGLDVEYEYASKDYMSCILVFFFGNVSPKQALDELTRIQTPSTICGKSINKAEMMFMCADCSKLGTCTCYCLDCYDPSKHVGHRSSYQIGSMGCCDCGDEHSLKPESFCKEHQQRSSPEACRELLPAYYKVYGPIIWEHVMCRLHRQLCEINLTQVPEGSDAGLQAMLTVLLLLSNIFRISPLFHDFVAEALMHSFTGHRTTHVCRHGELVTQDHECTCSVLDNILKYILCHVENRQVSEFLAQLAKVQHRFGVAFLQAFWKNYPYLKRLTAKRQGNFDFLDKIMWQVNVIHDDLLHCLPQHADVYLASVESEVDAVVTSPANCNDIRQVVFLNLIFDYQYFYNRDGLLTDYLITKAEFLQRFVAMARKLQYINSVPPVETHVLYEHQGINVSLMKALYFWLEIFNYTMRYYKYDNDTMNANIFQMMLKAIWDETKEPSKTDTANTIQTPLLRLFATVLNCFMISHSSLSLTEVRGLLVTYSQLTEEQITTVLRHCIVKTFRGFGFLCEIEAGYWFNYGEAPTLLLRHVEEEKKYSLLYADISLVQMALALLPQESLDLYELATQASGISIFEPQKVAGKFCQPSDAKKEKRLVEKMLLLLTSCLFNDIARVAYYLKSSCNLCKSDTPEPLLELVEYALKKEATMAILKEEEKSRMFEMLSMDQLLELLPSYLRTSQAEKLLSSLFELNPGITGRVAYRVTKEIGEYINLFNLPSTKHFVNADYNIRAMRKLSYVHINAVREGTIQRHIKSCKAAVLQKLANSKESVDATLRLLKKEQEVHQTEIVQTAVVRLINELSQYQSPHWTPEVRECVTNQLSSIDSTYALSFAGFYGMKDPQGAEEGKGPSHIQTQAQTQGETQEPMQVVQGKVEESKGSKQQEAFRARQKQIVEEFMKKRQSFEMKNQENLKGLGNQGTYTETCSFCKEAMGRDDFDKKPYGYLCFLTSSGMYRKAYTDAKKKLVERYGEAILPGLRPEAAPERSKIFHNCGHVMHMACLEDYSKNTPTKIFSCPLCKNPFNFLLPALEFAHAAVAEVAEKQLRFFASFQSELCQEPCNLKLILTQFMDMFCTSLAYIDLTNLHSFLLAKQRYFKLFVDCILSFLTPASLTDINEYFQSLLRNYSRTIAAANQANIVTYRVFAALFIGYAKNGSRPSDLSQTLQLALTAGLNFYILQSALKHMLLSPGDTQDQELPTRLGPVFKQQRDALGSEVLSFLRKMVFLKSIIECWNYCDASHDRLRNFISTTQDQESSLKGFCELLNLPADPIDAMAHCVATGSSFKAYSKTMRPANVFKKLNLGGEKKGPFDANFVLATLQLSFELVSLPPTYEEVFNKFYRLNCKHCKKNEQSKCLCLVCGEIICANAPCCKFSIQKPGMVGESIGELNYHTISCCGGSGIFLYLYYGTLIMQSDKLGVQTGSMYINSFGKDISTYCKPNNLPFDSNEFKKFFLNRERYRYYRDMLALGKEKYEIWQEINKGSGIVRSNV